MTVTELQKRAREIGFLPRDSVRWLSPGELARVGVKVGLAAIFADYADKREIQAGLASTLLWAPLDNAHPGADVWVDFVADLGDGFDATYTVASYLAQQRLGVRAADGDAEPHDLPRGSLLVMGGDEVYPTASARDYEDRTIGPYRAALPQADDSPLLVALPGNHDWYDGLTSFLRMFAQGGTVGGWRLTQTRSYFAVQLPHRWWLLALDSQLGTYIDKPQLEYFEEHVTQNLRPGDGIILCSATPAWVHTATGDPAAFDVLHWFERTYLRRRRVTGSDDAEETGASVRLWITGDSHHYARYAEELPAAVAGTPPAEQDRRQMVTCGLGGAFLSATSDLPEALRIPPDGSRLREKDAPATFALGPATYPTKTDSTAIARRLAMPWRPEWLPRRNPGFAQLAAGVHAVGFLLMSLLFGLSIGRRPVTAVRTGRLDDLAAFALKLLVGVLVVLLLPWLVRLVRQRREAATPSTAVVAVALQLVCALVILGLTLLVPWRGAWPDWLVLIGCLVLAALTGAGLGSEAFALYVLTARSGRVFGWQMAGESVEDHKGFIRMRIKPDGELLLYPVIVDEVCREWTLDSAGRPRPGSELPSPRLAEPPIVVRRR